MKVLSIEFGQVSWIFDVSLPNGGLYLPESVPKLLEKYGFVKFPTTDELLAESTNAAFEHGTYSKILIRKFAIYNDGLVAESKAGNEAARDFLDDFMDWAKVEFGATVSGVDEPYRIYDSRMIVQMDMDLQAQMKFTSPILEQLQEHMVDYGLPKEDYDIYGFSLQTDQTSITNKYTSPFRVERRIGKAFDKNVYFCAAPLKTNDHESLLRKLERFI